MYLAFLDRLRPSVYCVGFPYEPGRVLKLLIPRRILFLYFYYCEWRAYHIYCKLFKLSVFSSHSFTFCWIRNEIKVNCSRTPAWLIGWISMHSVGCGGVAVIVKSALRVCGDADVKFPWLRHIPLRRKNKQSKQRKTRGNVATLSACRPIDVV